MRRFPLVIAIAATCAGSLGAQLPTRFENLLYFPKDIARDTLINIMRGFSFALGVRCQYCHAGGDGVSFVGVEFKSDDKPATGISADALRIVAEMERGIADGKLDVVSTQALQSLMAAACRVYAARTEAGEQFIPLAKNSVTATDVMVTASGLKH